MIFKACLLLITFIQTVTNIPSSFHAQQEEKWLKTNNHQSQSVQWACLIVAHMRAFFFFCCVRHSFEFRPSGVILWENSHKQKKVRKSVPSDNNNLMPAWVKQHFIINQSMCNGQNKMTKTSLAELLHTVLF